MVLQVEVTIWGIFAKIFWIILTNYGHLRSSLTLNLQIILRKEIYVKLFFGAKKAMVPEAIEASVLSKGSALFVEP